MITHLAKKSLLYNELEPQKREEFFSLKNRKFLHNIDSLYYVVRLEDDEFTQAGYKELKNHLEMYRQLVKSNSYEPVKCFDELQSESFIMNGIGSSPYQWDLEQKDRFIAFFLDSKPNKNTPEIWLQIRSQFLWLSGEHEAVLRSIYSLQKLTEKFGITIKEIRENRIDFAYHTNYIQNPTSYFKNENINKMQQSRYERGSMEFEFPNQTKTVTDYITLGRKKSNNTFFRIYDKTKEVVQQQYKQFFIEIWYQNQMISYFDKFCLEHAFLKPTRNNHKYIEVGRLLFYLEYGTDQHAKQQIESIIYKKSLDFDEIISLADTLVPPVTKILNVEIETKRKFYYSLDSSIASALKVKTPCPQYARPLFRILDNKEAFHRLITCKNDENKGVIRFIDFKAKSRLGKPWTKKSDFPTSDFWKRLQMTKVNKKYFEKDFTLYRTYQQELDLQLIKRKLINAVSVHSLYLHGHAAGEDLDTDIVDLMSTINESDIEHAIRYKTNKKSQLSNRLDTLQVNAIKQKDIAIVDLETGLLVKSY